MALHSDAVSGVPGTAFLFLRKRHWLRKDGPSCEGLCPRPVRC